METLILIVHVLVAATVVGLILLQQGKGAEAGASFGGGASQTVFGSQGSNSFLGKVTAVLATVFFLTSFGLAMVARQKADAVNASGVPAVTVEQSVPAGDAPLSAKTATQGATGNDSPVIESKSAESDEQSKQSSLPEQ